jgi:hypothetical protein
MKHGCNRVLTREHVMELSRFKSKGRDKIASCCVEAECHFYYLRDSSLYVHESYPLGYQRHPLTYVGHRRFWYGPLTKYGS